ncbi:MAG: hypothetical protein JSU63_20525 [Phycisphaerales bacterium]|nr:MAG: hypothetical protein JSU63_20525 [Phycisphaerales bacterium]
MSNHVPKCAAYAAPALILFLCVACPFSGPGTIGGPCREDSDCDDELSCNSLETCEEQICRAGTPPCGTSDDDCALCDEDDDWCVAECAADADCDDGDECTTDSCDGCSCGHSAVDCDDGLFCTGTETCDSQEGCLSGDSPCVADLMRDEKTGKCVICLETADCDDADLCTEDECEDNVCVNTDVQCPQDEVCVDGVCREFCTSDAVCDDGDACTDDYCDSDQFCFHEPYDCDDGDLCTDDECVDGYCISTETDCDDGLFCTGVETCDPAVGCVSSGDPCPAPPPFDPCAYCCIHGCDEQSDECLVGSGHGWAYLTIDTDDLVCGARDVVFDASLFETADGTLVNTLNDEDSIDGGEGTDTLDVQFTGTGPLTITPALLAGVEIIELENTVEYPMTLDLVNAEAVHTVSNKNTAVDGGDLFVTNVLVAPTDFGWADGTERFTVDVAGVALSGTSDSATLTVSGVVDVDDETVITVQPEDVGSGYETITIVSPGDVPNRVRRVTGGNGTSLATVNFSGSALFTLEAELDETVTTIDAGETTGDVAIPIHVSPGPITCIGGSGDDTFDFSASAGRYGTADTIGWGLRYGRSGARR